MVAIGGIGGSGTRVITELLDKCGYFVGNDLNDSNDNLLFTLLFKRESILVSTDEEFSFLYDTFMSVIKQDKSLSDKQIELIKDLAENDRTLHKKEWLIERLRYLVHNNKKELIGFKEPNTHIVIERLFKLNTDLKFIYVFRNGLDMAYSSNQNQLQLWGKIFFNKQSVEVSPCNSLKYWVMVHKRIVLLQKKYPDRIMMLDFDYLCKSPEVILKKFSEFIKYNGDVMKFKSTINLPDSIGRYKEYSLNDFDEEDLDFVKNIYDI